MGNKFSASQLAHYRAVDEVLHYVWDPIGVSNFPRARDEYHSYLPLVFQLLQGDSEADEIAKYLSRVAVDRMGLSANVGHDIAIAQLLVEWRQLSMKRYIRPL